MKLKEMIDNVFPHNELVTLWDKDKETQRAIDKIVVQRKTERWCLKRDGYTRMKIRMYDKKKIEKEAKERYEKIKKERGWS